MGGSVNNELESDWSPSCPGIGLPDTETSHQKPQAGRTGSPWTGASQRWSRSPIHATMTSSCSIISFSKGERLICGRKPYYPSKSISTLQEVCYCQNGSGGDDNDSSICFWKGIKGWKGAEILIYIRPVSLWWVHFTFTHLQLKETKNLNYWNLCRKTARI